MSDSFNTLLDSIRAADIAREEQKAKDAWEFKKYRWTSRFQRHDPTAIDFRPKIKFLVDGMLPTGYTILLASESKEGKTAFLDGLSLAVAKGEDFAGHKVRQGGVLWCAFEENRNQRSINLLLDEDYRTKDLDIYTSFSMPPLHHEEAREMLQVLCLDWNIRLIVIDPLAGATGYRSLTEGNYIRRIMDTLNDVAYMCDCSIVITHQVSTMGAFRIADSIQIQAAAGMMMHYNREKLADGSHLISIQSKGRGAFANQSMQFRSTSPLHYEPYIGENTTAPVRSAREQSILDAVTNGYVTISSIADAAKINIHTCRNQVAKLVSEGALERIGDVGQMCKYKLPPSGLADESCGASGTSRMKRASADIGTAGSGEGVGGEDVENKTPTLAGKRQRTETETPPVKETEDERQRRVGRELCDIEPDKNDPKYLSQMGSYLFKREEFPDHIWLIVAGREDGKPISVPLPLDHSKRDVDGMRDEFYRRLAEHEKSSRS